MNLPIARDRKVSLRSGTSFAAAIAAGAAARLRDAKPDLTPADVVRILRSSSRAVEKGRRVIDVQAAVNTSLTPP